MFIYLVGFGYRYNICTIGEQRCWRRSPLLRRLTILYKIDILLNYAENHMYDTEIKENHSAVIEIIYENLKTTLQYITLLKNNSRENLYYTEFLKYTYMCMYIVHTYKEKTIGGFIKGILRGVRCTKSLRVLFLHRRPPSWTTLTLYCIMYSRAIFILNEPASYGTVRN